MDDMRAFEAQLGRVLQEAAGPSRPTDVATVVRATTTASPTWGFRTMFSAAAKFVVAGAIVALFGGFLLAGVLTRPSDVLQPAAVASASASPEASPTATPSMEPTNALEAMVRTDLVPGVALTVEEITPGVYRVLDDGAGHDLMTPLSAVLPIDDRGKCGSSRTRGARCSGSASPGRPPGGRPPCARASSAIERFNKVAADGTVWALRDWDDSARVTLYRFDGTTWIEQPLPDQIRSRRGLA